jgi:predicted ABC-class ATPase
MQRLVAKSKEPITPFVDKVRQLYEQHGVSTVLVVGGSGDYFKVADTVIMMDEYMPVDVTEEARRIAAEHDSGRTEEGGEAFGPVTPRIIHPDSFDASRGRREKVDAKGLATILYGTQAIDLSQVEQLVDPSQTRAIALMMQELAKQMDKRPGPEKQLQKQMPKHAGEGGELTLSEQIGRLYEKIAAHGLDILSQYRGKHPGDLALPRKFELAAAVNRLRTLRARPAGRQKR